MDIATKALEVHRIVRDLSVEERRRVFVAVGALCGDAETPQSEAAHAVTPPPGELGTLPPKAARWMMQNKISVERIEDFFHIDARDAEVILVDLPGRSRREQTGNCYLLAGVRSLLASGEPNISEAEVIALCKRYKCHDSTNHATYRRQSSNYLAGDKDRGFVLSAPGLRAAAELIRSIQ